MVHEAVTSPLASCWPLSSLSDVTLAWAGRPPLPLQVKVTASPSLTSGAGLNPSVAVGRPTGNIYKNTVVLLAICHLMFIERKNYNQTNYMCQNITIETFNFVKHIYFEQ